MNMGDKAKIYFDSLRQNIEKRHLEREEKHLDSKANGTDNYNPKVIDFPFFLIVYVFLSVGLISWDMLEIWMGWKKGLFDATYFWNNFLFFLFAFFPMLIVFTIYDRFFYVLSKVFKRKNQNVPHKDSK